MLKACKVCHIITEQNVCPVCSSEVEKDWQGYCIILDHSRSVLAKKQNITYNGKYALKVR